MHVRMHVCMYACMCLGLAMGLAKGKLEALLFHVYDLKGDTRLTTEPISLRAPSGSGRSVTHTCQIEGACAENRKFGAILRKFELDHPNVLPFNQTRFTLEEDDEGRWVHKPWSKKKNSSVSDHFHFELVSKFTGVRPTSPPAL